MKNFLIFADGVNTCNATQLRCIGNITKELFLYEYPFLCKCIPNCNVVSYQIKNIEESNMYLLNLIYITIKKSKQHMNKIYQN